MRAIGEEWFFYPCQEIEVLFARGRAMPERNRIQSMFPAAANRSPTPSTAPAPGTHMFDPPVDNALSPPWFLEMKRCF
jgi:hypothetical protein